MNVQYSLSAAEIDILVVVDTDSIVEAYPNPSTDMSKPTGINSSHQFLLCDDPHGVMSGQGTGNLCFRAYPGDLVMFAGTSIYQNSRDAVILYDIRKNSGHDVFDRFVYTMRSRSGAVVPDVSQPNGLPPLHKPMTFSYFSAGVAGWGDEKLSIAFGLYQLEEDGQTQSLFGYFYWAPAIVVTGGRS